MSRPPQFPQSPEQILNVIMYVDIRNRRMIIDLEIIIIYCEDFTGREVT